MVVTPDYMVVYISSNLRAIQDRSSTFICLVIAGHTVNVLFGADTFRSRSLEPWLLIER